MRGRLLILSVALVLALSCTAEEGAPVKPEREKTQAEQVEAVLLSTYNTLSGIRIENFDDLLNFILDNVDVDITEERTQVVISKDGRPVVTVEVRIDDSLVLMTSLSLEDGRVRFESDTPVSVPALSEMLAACKESDDDLAVLALTEWFNSNHNVFFTLDGTDAGNLIMKPYEKDGRLIPAFVMDYLEGASCYIQLL